MIFARGLMPTIKIATTIEIKKCLIKNFLFDKAYVITWIHSFYAIQKLEIDSHHKAN